MKDSFQIAMSQATRLANEFSAAIIADPPPEEMPQGESEEAQ